MYINVDVKISNEQIEAIKKGAEEQVKQAIEDGQLSSSIKDVVKGVIRSEVNEQIQTKGYRKLIADKVTNVLMENEEAKKVEKAMFEAYKNEKEFYDNACDYWIGFVDAFVTLSEYLKLRVKKADEGVLKFEGLENG